MTHSTPRMLAVDTSTLTLSIALVEGATLVAESHLKMRRGHSHVLLGVVDGLLRHAGWSLARDVDALVIGLGPGSFTGLRVGLAMMKGLAFAHGKRLFGASSLEAMALAFAPVAPGGLLCPCIDARKQEIYTARYRADGAGGLAREGEEAVIPPATLLAELSAGDREESVFFFGSGAERYAEMLSEGLGERAQMLPSLYSPPRAAALTLQVRERIAAGEPGDPIGALEPRYLRPSDAEMGNPGQKKKKKKTPPRRRSR